MTRWIYAGLVVVFWLASMAWLVTDRILPAFHESDAPLALPARLDEPIGWEISINNDPVGFAVMQAVPRSGRVTEVHSLIELQRFRVPVSTPGWLTPAFASLDKMQLSVRSTQTYDAFKELSSFRASLDVGKLAVPIRIYGRVNEQQLQMTARFGDTARRFDHRWLNGARLTNGVSLAARLLPLYEGRRWTQEMLNPLASPHHQVEMIQGEVVERLRIEHNGEMIDGWRVDYHSLETTGSSKESRRRAAMLVDLRGNVIRQEFFLLGIRLTLSRVDEEASRQMADEHLEIEGPPTDPSAGTSAPAA